jgi:hypothetical protein
MKLLRLPRFAILAAIRRASPNLILIKFNAQLCFTQYT